MDSPAMQEPCAPTMLHATHVDRSGGDLIGWLRAGAGQSRQESGPTVRLSYTSRDTLATTGTNPIPKDPCNGAPPSPVSSLLVLAASGELDTMRVRSPWVSPCSLSLHLKSALHSLAGVSGCSSCSPTSHS